MLYFKTSQPVPGKGDAEVYYECTDEKTIVRYVTRITLTDEVERVSDPIVKKLYRPESLCESSQEEFERHWSAP
ncbi:MAG TPA: hypothetical protein PLO62_00015 [Candidatus Hydrogenedentes bacterium]|nr:hypothetical protein [Candidatus Hydrogenedentota bacterium]HOS04111.1 hypothetical protein [Candidatus Hydrogenedentota bacterium]